MTLPINVPDEIENLEIGWVTYVEDASVADAPPPGLKAQAIGSGLIFELCDHFPSSENPEDVALGTIPGCRRRALRVA